MLSIARGVTGCNVSLCTGNRILNLRHFCSLLAGAIVGRGFPIKIFRE